MTGSPPLRAWRRLAVSLGVPVLAGLVLMGLVLVAPAVLATRDTRLDAQAGASQTLATTPDCTSCNARHANLADLAARHSKGTE